LEAENRLLRAEGVPSLIAESPSMQPVLQMISRVGPSDARGVSLDDVVLSNGAFTISNVSVSPGPTVCAISVVTGGQQVHCDLGPLAAASTTAAGRTTVSYQVTATFKAPRSLSGPWYAIAITDPSTGSNAHGSVYEADKENNNSRTTATPPSTHGGLAEKPRLNNFPIVHPRLLERGNALQKHSTTVLPQ